MIPIADIRTLEDLFEAQHSLNKQKLHLSMRSDQTRKDWLEFYEAYLSIDSKANAAYCLLQAERFGAAIETPAAVVGIRAEAHDPPEPEFDYDWQREYE